MQSKHQRIKKLKRLAQEAYDDDRPAAVVELLPIYLDSFPTDDWAWFLYGDALRMLGRKGAAVVALKNSERICPSEQRWTVQGRLGMLFESCGDYSAAEKWYARALESEEAQQSSWMWIFRGGSFAKQELFDEAEDCYRKAIAANEEYEEAYLNLAMVYRSQGKYEEAVNAAKTALTICPDYPEAIEVLRSLKGADASRELVARLAS